MAQTPQSGADPYCGAATALKYHDWRQWADLCSDEGTRGNATTLESGGQPDGARLAQLLASASGEIEERCFTGERYTPEDLAALTGNSLARLQELVADLAFWRATKRRWPQTKRDDVPGAKEAEEALKRLADGEAVFGLLESQEAGLSKVVPFERHGTSRVVRAARRFFGKRSHPECGE